MFRPSPKIEAYNKSKLQLVAPTNEFYIRLNSTFQVLNLISGSEFFLKYSSKVLS